MTRYLVILILMNWVFFTCTNSKDKEKKLKVFKYNQSGGLNSLDPAFARNRASIWTTTQIYNGLLALDKDLNIQPSLAESWHISTDGLIYTFKLREGIKFHNSEIFPQGKGREVKAKDFVYSFKRIIDPSTTSTGAWIFNDKVLRDKLGNIADTCFKAVDDYTLKIYLQTPFAPFLQLLTMPYAFVVPKEGIDKYHKEFRSHPVGTGPFIFKEWQEGNILTLIKNPNYWKKDNLGKPLPYLDAIQISFVEDAGQAFRAFEQGKLDMLSGITDNSRDLILEKNGKIRKELQDKFIVEKVPYLNTEYIGFQMDSSKYKDKNHPLLNKKVRQALNYAIDRDELIHELRNNLGKPGTAGFVPFALTSFDQNKVNGYNYDLKKAQELLKESGFADSKKFPKITLYTYSSDKEIAEYLQKQWANLGIEVEIITNQFTTHQELVDNGRVVFFRGSWLGDYPDPENYLAIFYSKNFAPQGPNKTHFSDKIFDALYQKAKEINIADKASLHAIYQQMDQLMIAEAPVIVLFYDEILRVMNKKVKGLETNATNVLVLENVDFK